jgi:hypothetical protein
VRGSIADDWLFSAKAGGWQINALGKIHSSRGRFGLTRGSGGFLVLGITLSVEFVCILVGVF